MRDNMRDNRLYVNMYNKLYVNMYNRLYVNWNKSNMPFLLEPSKISGKGEQAFEFPQTLKLGWMKEISNKIEKQCRIWQKDASLHIDLKQNAEHVANWGQIDRCHFKRFSVLCPLLASMCKKTNCSYQNTWTRFLNSHMRSLIYNCIAVLPVLYEVHVLLVF